MVSDGDLKNYRFSYVSNEKGDEFRTVSKAHEVFGRRMFSSANMNGRTEEWINLIWVPRSNKL